MNNTAQLISFSELRQRRAALARSRLLTSLGIGLPLDMREEEGTQVVVLLTEDWSQMSQFFQSFELDLRPDTSLTRLVDLWGYLRGELGGYLRLLLERPSVYHSVKGSLGSKTQEYLQALSDGNRSQAASLAKSFDYWNCSLADVSRT